MSSSISAPSSLPLFKQKFFHDAVKDLEAALLVPTDIPIDERDQLCGSLAARLVCIGSAVHRVYNV